MFITLSICDTILSGWKQKARSSLEACHYRGSYPTVDKKDLTMMIIPYTIIVRNSLW